MKQLLLSGCLLFGIASPVIAETAESHEKISTIDPQTIVLSAVSAFIGGGIVGLLKAGAKKEIETTLDDKIKPQLLALEALRIQLAQIETRQSILENLSKNGLENLGNRLSARIDPLVEKVAVHDDLFKELSTTLGELKIDVKVLVQSVRKMES